MNSLTQLTNFANQSINYTQQGSTATQVLNDQYQINGLIDTAQPVLANLDKLCNAAGSWLSYDIHQGKWGVIINSSGTSIASFSDHNIIDNITISGSGLANLYNQVKVQFPHRDLQDSADFVTISIPDSDKNPNEPTNILNITYDIINDPIQAQLLGFIELKQSRVDKIIKFRTDYSNFNLSAGDIIDVTNDRFGYTNKLFRILTISEIQDTLGPLILEITALEYDASVYNPNNLYKYNRTDANGIVTIGSIGVPDTPTVTKFEVGPRPHVTIAATAPTGIIEGMEIWISEDVTLDENARSYTLLTTTLPPGGGVYESGTGISYDYDNLQTKNFLVKVRGFNSTVTGPFSSPSGIIEFTATQVTQAIDSNTGLFSGGVLGGLGLLFALNSLLDFFGGDETKGLYDKISQKINQDIGGNLGQDIPLLKAEVTSATTTATLAYNLATEGGLLMDETWTTDNVVTTDYVVDNLTIRRYAQITFARPNGVKITLDILPPT